MRKLFTFKLLLPVIFLGSMLPGISFGQIAGWNTFGQSAFGTQGLAPAIKDANVTVTGLTRGSGVSTTGTAGANLWGGTGWSAVNAADAIANNKFVTFSITPNPGFKMSLTSLNPFIIRLSSTAPVNFLLQYQVGSGSFTDIITKTVTRPSSTSNFTLSITDLSTFSDLQNVSNTITFRIVPYPSTSTGGAFYIGNQTNVTHLAVNGTVSLIDAVVTKNVAVAALNNGNESGINGKFNVTLSSNAPTGGVTINYTLDGTAVSPADYTDANSGSLTIPAGANSGTITLNIQNDNEFEPTEKINITITDVNNGFLITTDRASIDLIDNEVVLFNGTYIQDFNTLSNTAINTPWVDNVTTNGWYSNKATFTASAGSSSTGSLYSFGANSNTERALGAVASGGSGTIYYGIRLKNNTGSTITNLQVSYKGEQWRKGGSTESNPSIAQTINFSYLTGTSVTSLSGSTFINVSNLNFTSPRFDDGASALDGNLPENSTSVIYHITGLNIPPGNEIMLRWEDVDNPGNDHGLSIDDLVITNQLCATPVAKPTALTFNAITENSIQGSFTAANPAASKYLVVMSANSSLASNPVDGQVYELGDNIGDGSVIGYSSSTAFAASELSAATKYYFFIFPVNTACIGGTKYLTTDPLSGDVTTAAGLPPCSAPTEQATNLVLSNPTINSIQGAFTGTTANEYLVLKSLSAALSNDPVNGQVYNAGAVIGNATVVQRSSATSFTATGLAPDTRYYFYVFSLNSQGCLNGPAYNIISPLTQHESTLPLPVCATPTAQPSNLALNSTNSKITGTFNPAAGGDSYLVIRSLTSSLTAYPEDNTDYNPGDNIGGGIVVANDISTSFFTDGLTPSTTYYIFIFSSNINCTGGTKYLTATPLQGSIQTTSTPPNFVYFGNLHSHSDYSDGNKDRPGYTPALDYAYAKDAECLDFLGISEHNHYSNGDPGNLITNYHQGLTQADNFNLANPNFVALYGMEWGTISGGGHVVIYGDGMNKLYGWESNVGGISGPNYDVLVNKGDYRGANGLFKTINDDITTNTFATLAHPNSNDFNNLSISAYDIVADNAIVGTAIESGPAFSTNTTYSNPASSLYFKWYYEKLLSRGYHLGPVVDHDNHNTTFGKTTRSRTAVIAPVLNRAEIVKAMREMRFYSTEDCDAKVDFSINTRIMGSVFQDRNAPSISVSLTDPSNSTSGALIRIKFGIPGSGVLPITIDSVYGSSINYIDNNLGINSTGYYYIHITNGDAEILTSPIWYTRLCVNTSANSIIACENYTWPSNGVTYTESGNYIHSYTTQAGCSNTDTLHLIITHPAASDTTAIACDNLNWYGQQLNESGTYIKVLKGYGGCDSTITLHLTINHSSTSSETIAACDSYTWNGKIYNESGEYTFQSQNAENCTHTARLYLTINHSSTSSETVIACDSYTWNGTTYDESGVYTFQSQNAENCTNTATLNLTINPKPTVTIANAYVLPTGVNANTVYTGYGPASMLSVTAIAGGGTPAYSYLWSAGSGLSIVPSTVDQSTVQVYASQTGNYSSTLIVKITDSKGCLTSKTIDIYVLDISDGINNDKVSICHNGNTLSVSSNAVNEHLKHGDILGSCNAIITYARTSTPVVSINTEPAITEPFEVKVLPNPSTTDFKIRVVTNTDDIISIRLSDISGRVMGKLRVYKNQTTSVGSNLKAGTYILEVIQGAKNKKIKLVKLN